MSQTYFYKKTKNFLFGFSGMLDNWSVIPLVVYIATSSFCVGNKSIHTSSHGVVLTLKAVKLHKNEIQVNVHFCKECKVLRAWRVCTGERKLRYYILSGMF